jgi:hypothetical protein
MTIPNFNPFLHATRKSGRVKNPFSRQNMNIEIREMKIEDYDEIFSLWNGIDGIIIDDVDSKGSIGLYIERKKGLSYIAQVSGIIVGTVLCGHDGRRGLLRHLAVKSEIGSWHRPQSYNKRPSGL